MQLVKKISVATVVGKVPTVIVAVPTFGDDGKPVLDKANAPVMENVKRAIEQPLMRVLGLANAIKTGNSAYGGWIAFMGQFEATNILTGEVYRGAALHLPDTAADLLAPVVKKADGADVMIGFDIGVKPSNTAQGYEYTVTPLTKPSENDALAALKASAFADLPALPAPKAADPAPTVTETPVATEAPAAGKKK